MLLRVAADDSEVFGGGLCHERPIEGVFVAVAQVAVT